MTIFNALLVICLVSTAIAGVLGYIVWGKGIYGIAKQHPEIYPALIGIPSFFWSLLFGQIYFDGEGTLAKGILFLVPVLVFFFAAVRVFLETPKGHKGDKSTKRDD